MRVSLPVAMTVLFIATAVSANAATSRIVAIGGDVTEIVSALGRQSQLVGVDTTSTFPAEIDHLPRVGYLRNLSAEGILSLSPDLVLVSKDAGPPFALDQVRQAGVPVKVLPGDESPAGVAEKIRAAGIYLEAEEVGNRLATIVASNFSKVISATAAIQPRTRVLFMLSIGRGAPLGGGHDTGANRVIELAGGISAIGGFTGYKPLSPEAVVESSPAVVLVIDRTLQLMGGAEAVLALPLFAGTPAARDKQLITMDGLYLLGFGPRTPEAIRDLALALYPYLNIPPLDEPAYLADGKSNQ